MNDNNFEVVSVGSVRNAFHNSVQKNLTTKPSNFPASTVGFASDIEAAKN